MTDIGAKERVTQNRVVRLFQDQLAYTYLGDWRDRPGNSNMEEALVSKYLAGAGYSPEQISRALHLLRTAATVANTDDASLYPNVS